MSLGVKIAVIDDDPEMVRTMEAMLKNGKYDVATYTSAAAALDDFKLNPAQVVITDLHMKNMDGMALLREVNSLYPQCVTMMMTAFGSIDSAVTALRSGAYDYIVKPFNMDDFLLAVKRAAEKAQLIAENSFLKSELKKEFSIDSILGKSLIMQNLFDLIKRIAPASANVLIAGDSGTGKELVARAIHNLGPRKNKPFVAINCTAIPEELLESELFGHVRGSFTGAVSDKKGLFEAAQGGTLFLDEIGDMTLPLQGKLLRVIQDREIRAVGSNESKTIDVRIMCATHRNLKAMVDEGRFREDLFYRLSVIPVNVPSLKERAQDIPLLVEHFVRKFAIQNGSKVRTVTPEAMAQLLDHPWPGNVRELENLIERAVVLSTGEQLTDRDVKCTTVENSRDSFNDLYADRPTIQVLEERYIRLVLAQCRNKKEAAAKILGVNRRTLYRKEREYGLVSKEPRRKRFMNPQPMVAQ